MGYLFTSECVSDGHPDKIADQISDAILDNILAFDPDAKVACETLVTTGQVVVAGEVSTTAYVDIQEIVRKTIRDIGYTNPAYMFDGNSCGVLSAIHEQSPDIQRGVDKETKENQGAGDQGMVFGYACNETKDYIPLSLYLARRILQVLKEVKDGHTLMPYLRPDAKCQVTVEYEGNKPVAVSTIVVSTQHDPFGDDEKMRQNIIRNDILRYVIPKALHGTGVYRGNTEYLINPTGNFVIGGPHGDTGLTGRKIIVDTYGGKGSHGGGAFSGKDPSKVDRSGAYMARYIAKNMVAAGVADEMLVQISYAIGVAEPVSIYVNTYGRSNVSVPDEGIAQIIGEMFDLRPYAIEKALGLRNPIYLESASYGHMGREPKVVKKRFESRYGEGTKEVEVCLFSWEALDKVDLIREKFGI